MLSEQTQSKQKELEYQNAIKHIEDDKLYFEVKNTISPKRYKQRVKSHGIGLQNVKDRLEVYFPNAYEVNSILAENTYESILIVDLSQLVKF